MFKFIKEKLQNVFSQVTTELQSIFSQSSIDESTIHEIEKILLKADTGVATTKKIIIKLQASYASGVIKKGSDIKDMLHHELTRLVSEKQADIHADVYLLVGINGSGKTTFVAKLAHFLRHHHKTSLIAAADTFRAAAPEQLALWAEKTDSTIVTGKFNQDPAAVTFDACKKFASGEFDALVIDTAGRLQTKDNLMKELKKIHDTITRLLPDKKICTLLTIDSMLGQNCLDQARIFNQSTKLDGIVLTKMDGTGKGGIVFSIIDELKVPVAFLSWGESLQDMAPFESKAYVANLIDEKKLT